MKFLTFVILALVAYCSAEEDKVSKRASGYSTATARPSYATAEATPSSTYTKISQPGQKQQVQYLSSQPSSKYSSGFSGSQQQYDFDPQSFGKVSFAAAPGSQSSVNYSPASDVSSFSYSSPSVQYNSLGYLQQFAGKLAAAAPETAAYSTPTQQVAYAAASPTKFGFAAPAAGSQFAFAAPSQKYTFASPSGGAFSGVAARGVQFAAPQQQYVYSAAPAFAQQAYAGVPQGYAAQLQAAHSQPAYAVAPAHFGGYSGYTSPLSKYTSYSQHAE